jgi:hypothetical protein
MNIPVSRVEMQASLIPIKSTMVDYLVDHLLLIVDQLIVLDIQDPHVQSALRIRSFQQLCHLAFVSEMSGQCRVGLHHQWVPGIALKQWLHEFHGLSNSPLISSNIALRQICAAQSVPRQDLPSPPGSLVANQWHGDTAVSAGKLHYL